MITGMNTNIHPTLPRITMKPIRIDVSTPVWMSTVIEPAMIGMRRTVSRN